MEEPPDRPIFARIEGLDFPFPVHDQLHGDRLHAPGGETAANFGPQQRRDLVPDEPVQNTPGLLRVDAIHIDRVGRLDRLDGRSLGDFVELDTFGILELEELREVPGDRLALAVGVGCEEYVGGRFRRVFEVFDDVALTFNGEVAGREPVLDVDSQRALGQVADMADRGLNDVARQVFLDGSRLRR